MSAIAEGARITAAAVWAVVVGVALTAGAVLAWVFLVQPYLVSQNAQNLRNSYGSAQARTDAARQAITAAAGTSGGQAKALTAQACALITDLTPAPSDLAAFYAKEC